jgi:Zn-dependent protease
MEWTILQLAFYLAIFIISIDVHEFSHALTAYRMGDDTAARQGRLSLNPLVHLDPMGTLMMVFTMVSGIGFGWGKPVPVNPYSLRRDPRIGMGIVAAAGPMSNILLALLLALPVRLDLPMPGLFPLDGYNVLQAVLRAIGTGWSNRVGAVLARMEPQGPLVFIAVILASQFLGLNIIGRLLDPAVTVLRRVVGV